MKIKRGVIIASDFGKGKIVAITKQWIVHEVDNGEDEVAILRGEEAYWIPAEAPDEDIDKSAEINY